MTNGYVNKDVCKALMGAYKEDLGQHGEAIDTIHRQIDRVETRLTSMEVGIERKFNKLYVLILALVITGAINIFGPAILGRGGAGESKKMERKNIELPAKRTWHGVSMSPMHGNSTRPGRFSR